MKSDWQCSHCFKTYNFEEWRNLKTVWIDENQRQYGKTMACTCGKLFHVDKWKLRTRHKLGYIVSTVHLELAHPSNMNFSTLDEETMWYETMIFTADKAGKTLNFQVRYPDQKSAIEGHILTYKMLPRIAEKPEDFPQDEIKIFLDVLDRDEYQEEKEEFQNTIFRKEKKV